MLDPSAVSPARGTRSTTRSRSSSSAATVTAPTSRQRSAPTGPSDSRPATCWFRRRPVEDEIARELEQVWLWPASGKSPYSGANVALFPWTLAKAFLSSPAALAESRSRERLRRLDPTTRPRETAGARPAGRTHRTRPTGFGQVRRAGRAICSEIGVAAGSQRRAVVFAERVATLNWLTERLRKDLKLAKDQVAVLHGGLSDTEQQEIVESFKLESSPIRVLVTGDVASEGVNLHRSATPGALRHPVEPDPHRAAQRPHRPLRPAAPTARSPRCCSTPSTERFSGDIRVLTRLVEREHEAHTALGRLPPP